MTINIYLNQFFNLEAKTLSPGPKKSNFLKNEKVPQVFKEQL